MIRCLFAFLLVLCLLIPPSSTAHEIAPDFGALPLVFERNTGQAAEPVDFVSRGSG